MNKSLLFLAIFLIPIKVLSFSLHKIKADDVGAIAKDVSIFFSFVLGEGDIDHCDVLDYHLALVGSSIKDIEVLTVEKYSKVYRIENVLEYAIQVGCINIEV